jgi:HEAT repeat protein
VLIIRGKTWFFATAALCAVVGAQDVGRLRPAPTAGLGGGPSASPREYAAFARGVVEAESARLLDRDPRVRAAACGRLGQLGSHGFDAVPALIEALGDSHRGTMLAAAHALAAIVSREETETISALEALARSEPAPGARGALETLSLMRLRREETAEVLSEFLEHQDYDARMAALQGLTWTPRAAERSVRALGAVLADPAEPEEMRIAAAECLRRFGDSATLALQDVVRALPDRRVGAAAARVMHDLGALAAPWRRYLDAAFDGAVADLIEFDRQFELARALDATSPTKTVELKLLRAIFASKDERLRDEAAFRAGQDATRLRQAAPDLVALLLRDPSPRVRARAAAALGMLGDLTPTVVDALLAALRDPAARFDAGVSLGLLSPDLEDVVGAFASAPDMPADDRAAILYAAARLAPARSPHTRRLAEILKLDADPMARGAALVFFGILRAAPPSADADLARALVDPVFEIRETARWTVARCYPMGAHGRTLDSLNGVAEAGLLPYWLAASSWWSMTPDDREMSSALSDFRHRLRYEVPRTRPLVAAARDIAPDVEAIGAAAVDSDARVREKAAQRAAELGRAAVAAAPRMRRLLSDPSRRVRLAATVALGAIGSAAGAAIPDVARLLEDPCWSVRRAAITALVRLGARPADVRDVVARRRLDPILPVREAATEALIALASGAAPEDRHPPSAKKGR